jgi:uncharacterized protein (TIGR03067 family)
MFPTKLKLTMAVLLIAAVAQGVTRPSYRVYAQSPQKKDGTKTDVDKLQGDWMAVAGENSKEKFDKELATIKLTVKGDHLTLRLGSDLIQATFKLDATKNPRHIDFKVAEGPGKGETFPGIYALEGESVKLCFSEPKQPRPTEFAAEGRPGLRTLLILRQAVPGKGKSEADRQMQ